MNPYYEDGTCTIYNARCEDVLPSLSGVGLVITSPPYNLGMGLDDKPAEAMHDRRSVSRAGAAANRLTGGYVEHEDAMPQAEYVAWQQSVLRSCWDALSPDGAIFYNHKPRKQAGVYRLPLALVPPELDLWQIVIWDRVERGQAYTTNGYVPTCEWLVVLAKPAFQLRSRAHSADGDVWRIHPERDNHGHPCPFPVAIPARIIDTAAAAGPVVDPFMGSGSTLVAAAAAGRKAVGIELSERYCEIAATRLAQGSLFGAAS